MNLKLSKELVASLLAYLSTRPRQEVLLAKTTLRSNQTGEFAVEFIGNLEKYILSMPSDDAGDELFFALNKEVAPQVEALKQQQAEQPVEAPSEEQEEAK